MITVLVHGSWHGAWAWDQMIPLLQDRGLRPITIDLPGPGRAEGDQDLAGHARALTELVAGIDEDVVLWGHSYGGAVIGEAAPDLPNVVGLGYLAGVMPDKGQTAMEALEAYRNADEPAPVSVDGELLRYNPSAVIADFYQDCPPELAAAAVAKLTPEHVSSVASPATHAGWRTLPFGYVVCGLDRAMPVAMQREVAKRTELTVELESGHSPMLSMPETLADVMADMTRKLYENGSSAR
ncbi:alpha/beta hydrolase [Pseudonocardiaceae bacterium YIM PH 21723]|nr:alpha/beta hydrolase [Pseudonocardiaceae bacterium YIM PH 21723]